MSERDGDGETWRPVPGALGYEVSDRGRVRSFRGATREKPFRLLKLSRRKDGYLAVGLPMSGSLAVHRLVLLAFRGPAPDGHEGAHLDGTRDNNTLANLAWVTPVVNASHREIHGTNRGRASGRRTLTEPQATQMRHDHAAGESMSALSQKYGITVSGVLSVLHGRTWSHAGGPIVAASPPDHASIAAICGRVVARTAQLFGVETAAVADLRIARQAAMWAMVRAGLSQHRAAVFFGKGSPCARQAVTAIERRRAHDRAYADAIESILQTGPVPELPPDTYRIRNAIQLVGQRFGMLVMTAPSSRQNRARAAFWVCRCDCGREAVRRGFSLMHGQTLSCGCRTGFQKKTGAAPVAVPLSE